jgi:hypothetical protein
MTCPRCSRDLAFVCHEDREDGNVVFEYLCERCLGYLQEYYSCSVLVQSIWGDLRHGRNRKNR